MKKRAYNKGLSELYEKHKLSCKEYAVDTIQAIYHRKCAGWTDEEIINTRKMDKYIIYQGNSIKNNIGWIIISIILCLIVIYILNI